MNTSSPTVVAHGRSLTDENPSRFRFRRYREALALRQNDNDNNAQAQAQRMVDAGTVREPSNPDESNSSDKEETSENDACGGAVLQNLSDAIVVVDECGEVSVSTEAKQQQQEQKQKQEQESPEGSKMGNIDADTEKGSDWPSAVPEGTTLLLRNLRNCVVTIHLPLPAVHLVGLRATTVKWCNDESANTIANTTIHATECHDRSSLRFSRPAQQLRIHGSTGLGIVVANACGQQQQQQQQQQNWKPGSIILEASRDVCFFVPPLDRDGTEEATASETIATADTVSYWHRVVVKDFHWLRKGIPSPNFRIEVLAPSSSRAGEDGGDEKGESTRTTDRGSVTPIDDDTENGNDSDDSDDEL